MANYIDELYKGLLICRKYNENPKIYYSEDSEDIIVELKISMENEDITQMRCYNWYYYDNYSKWRKNIEVIYQ